jgi:hypothetical protein
MVLKLASDESVSWFYKIKLKVYWVQSRSGIFEMKYILFYIFKI